VILRGIDFGNVFTASGTLNFFGQGWPFHKIYQFIPGFDFTGSTFTAKTVTFAPRQGNMPLDRNLQPKELMPKCIKVYFRKGIILNAVGLSNPGIHALLKTGQWQKRTKPFFISFMPARNTVNDRLYEMEKFVVVLKNALPDFKTEIGLEINISCPSDIITATKDLLKIASALHIPLILKINALASATLIKKSADSGLCDALSISNTIPWGELPDKIDWQKLFKTATSPLAEYGKDGLSGWPLLQITADKIREFRKAGINIPIIAGGGILCQKDIIVLKKAGSNAVAIASAAILRPWRIKKIINSANQFFKEVP